MKNLLVAQSGGPTAAINATVAGVVACALSSGKVDHIYGAVNGIEGVLAERFVDLREKLDSAEKLDLLAQTPAAALGSCRLKIREREQLKQIVEVLKKREIAYFIYTGGNDSMDTVDKLSAYIAEEGIEGIAVMGAPKTIDNDLMGTDHCPGFGSAARYAAQSACELALDASALPIHVVVLELMGRNAGWVTAASALAARLTNCEVLTYLPERLVDEEKMLSDIEARYAKGKGLLVTVSEGICGLDGKPFADTGLVDGFGHTIPGGTAQHISDQIIQKLGLKSRAEKPGLLGRTSIPYVSAPDREEAYAVGKYAVEAALRGESGSMVAIEAQRSPAYHSSLFLTPLSQVANVEKKFPLEWIVEGNQIADAFFDYAMPLMGGGFPQYALLRK